MIDLTVKTLDSQNHAFSLADDITVREFKEHIAETVNVPADSQRLIYCGRVLQDEKHLSEYDVNGKVIHLVQRAPPQSAQRGNSGGQSHGQNRSRGDQPQGQRMRYRQTRTQFHGNPMYLGSFSIPAEVVDGHEWPIPQLSNTLSNSRLVVARRMLDQANRVIDRLENPAAAAADDAAAAAASERDEAASTNGGFTATEAPQQDQPVNRAQQLLQQLSGSGSMGGILEFATAFAGPGRTAAFIPMRAGSEEGLGAEPSAPAPETTSDESHAQDQQQQTPRQEDANSGADQPGNARQNPPTGSQGPRPPQMAQLLGRLMDTQDRLRPFLMRYRELMELDPEIPGGRTASGEDVGTVEDNQRIADGVTECFHFLSHANHALSDIIVDVGQQPPRNLRCRPMLIQHSAILQAGIPIQVEAHISVARNDGSNGESGEENGDVTSRPPTSVTVTPPTSQNPIDLTFVTEQTDQAPPTAAQQQPEQQQQQQPQQAQSQPQVDSPFGAIFNITNNMEVLMEMGPPESSGTPGGSSGGNAAGTEQSQTTGGNNNNNNNNNNNAPGTSGVAGIFPWGPAPPPEVIRNLMNVVAGYMAQSAATVTTTVATTTSTATPTTCPRQRVQVGVGSCAAPNPGQSTQARSNVGTHPTTSTQTRSTARPHVFHPHAHPLGVGMGMGQNMDFDPFLPCNSHHIRRTPSATPTNTAATSSPQQTAQASQSTTPNGAGQTQPETPSAPGTSFYATGLRSRPSERSSTQPAADQRSSRVSLRDEIAKLRDSSVARSAEASNNEESENAPTLEELLRVRGINIMWHRPSAGSLPPLLQRLFTICSRIELSEWFAYLNNGSFNRDDVWSRLRQQLAGIFALGVTPELTAHLGTRIGQLTVSELRPYYSEAFDAEERQTNVRNGQPIDLPATIDAMLLSYSRMLTLYTKENTLVPFDDEWGEGFVTLLKDFARELVSVLLFSLRGDQAGLESVIRHIATRATAGHNSEFRDWILGSVVDWICDYCRRVERLPISDIIPSLVYKDAEEVSASSVNTEVPRPQETQPQPEPEPMETEEASGNRTVSDPLDLADGEEVPTTFPGHEALLPEWVPIIARDGIRQRRQLQLQGGGVTAFSDAYLDGLPSKRRKLVEQQKPRLLVSPTPNHSSIPASMERLVRENVVRAGVEEAEGAAAAVAADPGVRRAFGQAIRECLNPRRLQTPDFPDARRFPNATKFFADKDTSSKQ